MVKNQQQKWMYLPVGSNNNKYVPEEMDKTIIMSHQADTNAKRYLINFLSSIIMYIDGKQMECKRFKQVAAELNDAGIKYEDTQKISQFSDEFIQIVYANYIIRYKI